MHSRGFVLSENQAFAGQTRTPGPSRLHASPTRKNMTTGKRALGGSSNPLGQEMGSADPKQLFQDLMSRSPVKALGDRNAAKTPGPSKSAPGKQDASVRKGKGSESSPMKKGSELSPRKATTSNALQSINGKQRQTTELPFTKPGQGSTNDAGNVMKTPAPSQLGKARTMSRQNSFITPAANLGRAGQIKARMGELMDAEMGLSLQKGENVTEQVTEQATVQLTEEEMYPEIEYMPPSFHAKHPAFEFPDELDDLPRAKELGAKLSSFSTIGLRAAGPDDLSDVEVSPMETDGEADLAPPAFAVESDDDDFWPDVPVLDEVAVIPQPPTTGPPTLAKATTSAVSRPSAAIRTTATAGLRASSTSVRPSGAAVTKRPAATTSARTPTTSSSANGRTLPGKASSQAAVRATGLQRSIASAPGSRAVSSSTTTASRVTSAARPAATTARSSIRTAASTTRPGPTRVGTQVSIKAAQQAPAPKLAATKLNPKLIDFVDDDLGKQTAAALDRMDAEEGIESLQLDLGDFPEGE